MLAPKLISHILLFQCLFFFVLNWVVELKQNDLHGDTFGLLASHPLTPLVSLHHLEHTDPVFPNMTTMQALQHLLKAVNFDPQRILQKTVCYDRWFSWTVSVSWGYAVQIYGNHMLLPDVLPVQETFQQWKKGSVLSGVYTFNTREPHPDPCRRPVVFFLDNVSSSEGGITSIYKKSYENCSYDMASPRKLEEVRVFSHKLDLDIKQVLLATCIVIFRRRLFNTNSTFS